VASKQKISICILPFSVWCVFCVLLVYWVLLFFDGLVGLLCILKCVQLVLVLLFFGRFRIPYLCAAAEKNKKALHFTIDGFLHFSP